MGTLNSILYGRFLTIFFNSEISKILKILGYDSRRNRPKGRNFFEKFFFNKCSRDMIATLKWPFEHPKYNYNLYH